MEDFYVFFSTLKSKKRGICKAKNIKLIKNRLKHLYLFLNAINFQINDLHCLNTRFILFKKTRQKNSHNISINNGSKHFIQKVFVTIIHFLSFVILIL